MKLYKIKAPDGQISKRTFSRAMAHSKAKELSRAYGQEYKPFIFINDAIVHDHELTKIDTRKYVVTHYEVKEY